MMCSAAISLAEPFKDVRVFQSKLGLERLRLALEEIFGTAPLSSRRDPDTCHHCPYEK